MGNDTPEHSEPIEMTLVIDDGEVIGIAGAPPFDYADLWNRINITVVDYSDHDVDGPLVAVLGNHLVSTITGPDQLRVLHEGKLSVDDVRTMLGITRRRPNGKDDDHG